jgi:hypothetical protein
MILFAMRKLMFDVAATNAGYSSRKACVFFRPRKPTDENFLTIENGEGCIADVGNALRI